MFLALRKHWVWHWYVWTLSSQSGHRAFIWISLCSLAWYQQRLVPADDYRTKHPRPVQQPSMSLWSPLCSERHQGKLFSYCSDGTAPVSIMAEWAVGENLWLEVAPHMQLLLCFPLSSERTSCQLRLQCLLAKKMSGSHNSTLAERICLICCIMYPKYWS